jgi:tetratricopeptide (TPR) repeat protein
MKSAWRSWVPGAALIVLGTVLTYLPALRAGFVFDDADLITGNSLIKAGDGLYRFWRTAEAADYYPLTWTWWWLEWRLWGDRATGYHAVNVALHAVNAVLVWIVLRRLRIPGAWLAGLVFAVHPVNVATVAWISEQKNTLSMLFAAASVLFYLQFGEQNRWRWYALSLLAFVLALLSKTAVVMAPVVLLGCVWWTRGRVRRKDLPRIAPFFVLSLVSGLLTIWFQNHRALQGLVVRPDGFGARLAAAGWAPWFYLSKALLPVGLTMVYPKWNIDPSIWASYLPGVALVGVAVFLWRTRRPWARAVLFGLGYFVVTLFPVLGFFDQGFYLYSLVADHWQYYSIVGVIALAVAGGARVCRGQPVHWRALAGTALVAVLGAAAWARCRVYANNETLWRDAVARNPGAWIARLNLGDALLQAGRVPEAIQQFDVALRIEPDSAAAHYNLGDAMVRLGRVAEGIAQYEEALRINPGFAEAHNNLGSVLIRLGRFQEAARHWEEAIRIKPGYAEAHINLGNALVQAGRTEDALEQYGRALEIKPDSPDAHYNLGNAWARMGHVGKAVACYEQALRFKPDSADAHNALGNALVRLNRVPDALGHYEQAVRIYPGFAEAHNNWGASLIRLGKLDEAMEHWERALQIKPDYADAHRNLGDALARLGRAPEAIGHYEQVLRVHPNDARAHCALGIALEQSGNVPQARRQYEQALQLNPDYAEARKRLASLQAEPASTRTAP